MLTLTVLCLYTQGRDNNIAKDYANSLTNCYYNKDCKNELPSQRVSCKTNRFSNGYKAVRLFSKRTARRLWRLLAAITLFRRDLYIQNLHLQSLLPYLNCLVSLIYNPLTRSMPPDDGRLTFNLQAFAYSGYLFHSQAIEITNTIIPSAFCSEQSIPQSKFVVKSDPIKKKSGFSKELDRRPRKR